MAVLYIKVGTTKLTPPPGVKGGKWRIRAQSTQSSLFVIDRECTEPNCPWPEAALHSEYRLFAQRLTASGEPIGPEAKAQVIWTGNPDSEKLDVAGSVTIGPL